MRMLSTASLALALALASCGPAQPDAEEPAGGGSGAESAGHHTTREPLADPAGGERDPGQRPPGPGVRLVDRDADGIGDPDDGCPDEPEDRDGFQDEDGCPDPDNDRDGLSDVDDMCPMEPENRNGVQDEDGCPEGA